MRYFVNVKNYTMNFEPESNIFLVHKPSGPTSFDVVAEIRRIANVKKVGHAGTLDPMAEGLLIVGVGAGTKKLGRFLKLPKTYGASVLLGTGTDTGDITGAVLEKIDTPDFSDEKIRRAVLSLRGRLVLPVPVYSAVKIGGRRLYARARAGERFAPPARAMEIIEVSFGGVLKDAAGVIVAMELRVGSGVYARSIAEELGRRLGLPATLASLKRKNIGDYSLSDALSIVELADLFRKRCRTKITESQPISAPRSAPPKMS